MRCQEAALGLIQRDDGWFLQRRALDASILPGRYFVTILQTLFQSDYAGRLYWLNAMALALIAAIFLTLTAIKTKRTLD